MTTSPSALMERMFGEYRAKIFGYIASKNVPVSDREDVFSDILLKASQQAGRYDSAKASISTWVYTIARSVVLDYYRRRKQGYPLSDVLYSAERVEDCIEYEEELRELAHQLMKLPEKERRVIILRLYKGMSYKKIALALGISETNAGTIYWRAIGKLRKRMNGSRRITGV